MKTDIILPTFHLNGSSAHQVAEAYANALTSISEAQSHLSWTGPHPRDYYIKQKGMENYEKAREQHMARMDAIDRIRRDLVILQDHAFNHIS